VEALLSSPPAGATPIDERARLEAALAALDRARGSDVARDPPRIAAYRAEALRRLGRLREAAAAYAIALEADLGDSQALWEGLVELSERLCGHEEVVRLAVRASAKHPGRAWQWDALAEQARRRLALERSDPVGADRLPALREAVARRLEAEPCRHDDAARPATAAAAAGLGLDPAPVLAWLSALGACCCDCQVATVRGPREPA